MSVHEPVGNPRLGILADDLTGAHASAARLARRGRRAVVVWDPDELPSSADALVVDMRTRDDEGTPRERAQTWAKVLVAAGYGALELRVDTTLRGAAAEELAGLLAGAGLEDALVAAVPAYPDAGRTTVGGLQLVRDAFGAVRSFEAGPRIFGSERWASIGTSTIDAGPIAAADVVDHHAQQGCRRVLIDALDDKHLAVAADAVQLLRDRGRQIVTVSSGAWLHHQPAVRDDSFVLVVLASPTEANRAQLQELVSREQLPVWDPAQVAKDPVATLQASGSIVVIETMSLDGGDSTAAHAAAEAARKVLEAAQSAGRRCRGLIVTGGDAAAHLVKALHARSLEPYGEVRPLCPAGILGGGPWSGLPLITKGGVIGDPDTLLALVAVLRPQTHRGSVLSRRASKERNV